MKPLHGTDTAAARAPVAPATPLRTGQPTPGPLAVPASTACSCGGNCPRCAASGPVIARAPAAAAAAPTERDYRDFVQATIGHLNAAASFYAEPLVQMNAARFDTLIDTWYAMVTDRDKMITDHLGGDVLLRRELQAAYIAALRALMPKAATALGQTEDALYRINNGRIPLWAWQVPHRQEAGFSTPLADGQAVDPLGGNVAFASNGVSVTLLPDGVGVTDPANPTAASTRLLIDTIVPYTKTRAAVPRIVSFTPPARAASLQTLYPPGVSAGGSSGYGRGTTPEDVAGARVDPRSTTLRFHEGQHGLDLQAFIATNALPAFTGSIGQTEAQFIAAVQAYTLAVQAYIDRAMRASSVVTHCVGTTIDQYNLAQPHAGATIVRECTP
jgi:hypothetical protein